MTVFSKCERNSPVRTRGFYRGCGKVSAQEVVSFPYLIPGCSSACFFYNRPEEEASTGVSLGDGTRVSAAWDEVVYYAHFFHADMKEVRHTELSACVVLKGHLKQLLPVQLMTDGYPPVLGFFHYLQLTSISNVIFKIRNTH